MLCCYCHSVIARSRHTRNIFRERYRTNEAYLKRLKSKELKFKGKLDC